MYVLYLMKGTLDIFFNSIDKRFGMSFIAVFHINNILLTTVVECIFSAE